jgi:F420-non-reducing hydrogenase iron-sulfur subunit
LGFLCNWCSYAAADAVSNADMRYPPNVRFIRVMCTGRIDPEFLLKGFQSGADGIVILGCHPGDCHYKEGNYHALRRFHLLRRMLSQFGIGEKRVQLEWVSACESDKFVETISNIVKEIRVIGPLNQKSAEIVRKIIY